MKKTHYLLLGLLLVAGSCRHEQQSFIRLNQSGYHPSEVKTAMVISKQPVKGNFRIIEAASHETELEKPLQPIERPGWGTFSYFYRLDFSELEQEGEYLIRIPSARITSGTFTVRSGVFGSYPDIMLEFMRQQRCGYNPFLNVYCHQKDGRTMYGPMPDSTLIDVSGGWHDAGDQLKYLITSSNATARMLLAWEASPGTFSDSTDAMGRPGGNGIADVLDEARWGLDWIHKMHPAPGQLFHQVADDRDHISWKWPDKDSSDYGWGKGNARVVYFATGQPQGLNRYMSEATGIANLAGRSAAAMAIACRIWNDELGDPDFARKCLDAALDLYRMGREQEGYQQGNSYGAPYRYSEDTWTDDMEWGAIELFRTTGEQEYLTDAINYAAQAASTSWMNYDSAAHYRFYPFCNVAHARVYEHAGEETREQLAGYYRENIEHIKERATTNPYSAGVPFIWCSNNQITAFITQVLLYEQMTGDMQYHELMMAHLDWLFGRNPWGTSMFTGIPEGGEYPVDVHTSIWYLTGREVPGGLVDGPVFATIYNSLLGLRLENPDEFAAFQNDHVVYHDDIGDYSTNEPTMDGTADAIFMMALYLGQSN